MQIKKFACDVQTHHNQTNQNDKKSPTLNLTQFKLQRANKQGKKTKTKQNK